MDSPGRTGGGWVIIDGDPTRNWRFKTFMDSSGNGINKIAWHESGGQAFGITGDSEDVYSYSREDGTWGLLFSAASTVNI